MKLCLRKQQKSPASRANIIGKRFQTAGMNITSDQFVQLPFTLS
jgi:hypothetical protein